MKISLLLSSAALAVTLAGAASAAIVTNGSFENGTGFGSGGTAFGNLGKPGFSSWDTFQNGEVTGWTADTNGIEIQTDGTLPASGGANVDAQDGENYVELDTTSNSGMEQNIVLAAGRYVLSFWYSPRINSPAGTTNGIFFAITNGALFPVSGMADGVSGDVPFNSWTEFRREFTITADNAGNYKLVFDATTNPDRLGGLLDNVAITAVPVPAAGLMLIGALGGLAALRRRKAATA